MRNIGDNLGVVGQSITNEELVLYILGGLGSEYESIMVNFTSRHDVLSL